jgi:hypothetical protein
MGIAHSPVFYLKHDVSENGFSLPLQVELTLFDPGVEDNRLSPIGGRIQSPKRRILNNRMDNI